MRSVGRDIFDPVEGELCNSKKWKVSCRKWLLKMEGGVFLPALTVTASLCYGDRGVGSGGSGRGL